jgi:SAM-dependent methyltransferase
MSPGFRRRDCPLCGARTAREEVHSDLRAETMDVEELRPFWEGLFREKPFFSYCRCAICQLLYCPFFFRQDELASLYARMAPNMEVVASDAIAATQRGYFAHAAARAERNGAYLEIGPDVGHIVREAARADAFAHFWLFEPNRAIHGELRDAVAGRPATLLPGMDDLSAVPDGSVGLAVMVHVLDHLLDPLAMLEDIRAKLRPGGTLMIVTHDEQSLLRRVMGKRWPPFCLQHPVLFNPVTIRSLLTRAGFADVDVARSRNYFPLDFVARQAAWTMGLNPPRWLRLPRRAIGLRLGNIITLATVPHASLVAPRHKRLSVPS